MYRRVSSFLFPDPLMWLALVILTVIMATWSWASGFTVSLGETYEIYYLCIGGFVLGLLYHKRSPALAVFCFSLAYFKFMATALRPLSYLAVAAHFPLKDAQLAAFDKLIGFDWLAHVAWVNAHYWVHKVLFAAYASINPQAMFLFVFLFITANFERLREFIMIFFGMAIITTFSWMFMPAIAGYHFYQPDAAMIANLPAEAGRYAEQHFLATYYGQMRSLSLPESVGLITFPSFHLQSAALFAWITRRTKLFWPFLILNILMSISTISMGGHYVIDLIAGATVFIIVTYAYGLWAGRYRLSLTQLRKNRIASKTGFKAQFPAWNLARQLWHEKFSATSPVARVRTH